MYKWIISLYCTYIVHYMHNNLILILMDLAAQSFYLGEGNVD